MLKKKLLKGVLGVSAVAALFAALAAQAQSTDTPATGQSGTSQGATGQGSTASGTGTAAPAATAPLNRADQRIVLNLAQANMAEIEAAKLAQSKSQNEQIKNFAQQMIDDHTKALGDVQQLAQAKGVTLPAELDKTNKAKADKLAAMSGDAFDRAYVAQAGVADHKKVHGMLRQAQSRAKDPDVKALAERILPTVDQHLNSAQQLPGASKRPAKGAKAPAASGAPAENTSSQ